MDLATVVYWYRKPVLSGQWFTITYYALCPYTHNW